MKVSKVVLKRGKQDLILLGVFHIAPEKFYLAKQKEIEDCVNQGYKILYEGMSFRSYAERNHSKEEKIIAEFFKTIIESYSILADELKLSCEKKIINMPQGAINADITFLELVSLLGKKDSLPGMLFSILENEIARYCICREMSGFSYGKLTLAGRSLASMALKKMEPVLIDWRNDYLVETVELFDFPKSLVYYGEGHIQGIEALLKKKGWEIVSRRKLDIFSFK